MTLTIEEMADVLKNYRRRQADLVPAIGSDRDFFDTVFRHVRYHTGHDFSEYKQSTLERRLSKRMSVVGITSPSMYVEKLIRERDEAFQLQRDLLINVTGFFRDKDAFAIFEKKRSFPNLSVRVAQPKKFVAGCQDVLRERKPTHSACLPWPSLIGKTQKRP
ncbi:MAG: hypothetical protein AAGI92_07820 [Pseudomonadota bacterium]